MNRMVHLYHEITPDEFHKICLSTSMKSNSSPKDRDNGSKSLPPAPPKLAEGSGMQLFNLWITMTKNRNAILVSLITFLSFLGLMFSITIAHAQNEILMADKDYLISVCKKLEDENKINNKIGPWYDLDNLDVNIYTKNNYIVVDFVPKSKKVPGIVREGGGSPITSRKRKTGVINLLRLYLANRLSLDFIKGKFEMEKWKEVS